MSEDKTQDIGAKYDTKPTIETVLESIQALGEQLNGRINRLEETLDVRLHRIESAIHETKSNFHALRADFNELRNTLKDHFPAVR
jgi:chromosome segregation ATPase